VDSPAFKSSTRPTSGEGGLRRPSVNTDRPGGGACLWARMGRKGLALLPDGDLEELAQVCDEGRYFRSMRGSRRRGPPPEGTELTDERPMHRDDRRSFLPQFEEPSGRPRDQRARDPNGAASSRPRGPFCLVRPTSGPAWPLGPGEIRLRYNPPGTLRRPTTLGR